MRHVRYPDRLSVQNHVLKGTMQWKVWTQRLEVRSSANDSVLREREPADPQLVFRRALPRVIEATPRVYRQQHQESSQCQEVESSNNIGRRL